MTMPLRQKMIEDMQLNGLADRTQESYLLAVRQLARHYQKSPDQINEEELRQYFLYLKNEKHAARNTCTINLCGIKFFFQHTLDREWKTFDFVRPPREKKLPVVLSRDEVRRILATYNSTQIIAIPFRKQFVHGSTPVFTGRLSNLTTFCYNMHEGKSPLGKPRASPVSLASGEPHLVRLSLFGFGLSELGTLFQSL